MELDALVGFRQPDGRGVADEMDFMAPRGELHSQFGGDHSGAAISWVTCDSNLHLDRGKVPSGSSLWNYGNDGLAIFPLRGSLTNTVANRAENLLRKPGHNARFPGLGYTPGNSPVGRKARLRGDKIVAREGTGRRYRSGARQHHEAARETIKSRPGACRRARAP